MKHFLFTTFYLIFSISLLNAQQDNFKYHSDANYFEHNYGNPTTSDIPVPFIWQYFQTATTYQLTDLQFNGNLGWATHTDMGVVYTTNAGLNWSSVSFRDTTFSTLFNGIFFIDNNTGWAVGGAVSIRKTTNGGLNWFRQIPPPIAGVLNKIYFFDSNTGLAIGRQGANYNSCVIRSTNGGSNWNEIVVSTSTENELSDQYWFDANTGWICGRNFLKKSTDGGLTYTDYFSGVSPTSNGANALLCITFVNSLTGWIGGSNLDHQNLYKTTNGGLNWVFQTNPVSSYTYPQINDVKFIDANSGFAAHGTPAAGAILYTSNGGTNWTIDNGTNTWFDCLWINNNIMTYCGEGTGKVYYSNISTGIKKINTGVPDKFELSQNYPNPFNPVTNIKFAIPRGSPTGTLGDDKPVLKVYDILGKEIATLVNENLQQGTYEVKFDGSKLTSGVYFYRLKAGKFSETKKLMLIK